MKTTIQVRTNRGIKTAEVIRENPKTFLVRLPDGNKIIRHKVRDVVTSA